jgi:hypothetical protein
MHVIGGPGRTPPASDNDNAPHWVAAVYLDRLTDRLTSIIKLIQDSHHRTHHSPEVVIVLTKKGWQCHADVTCAAH